MQNIKIVAMDLDGTLLDSQKQLSIRNYNALEQAAKQGIEIVPSTGRYYSAMPEIIKSLPFIHYAITINGAQVYDVTNDKVISATNIPLNRAVEIMKILDDYPVAYNCYMDNQAWLGMNFRDTLSDYLSESGQYNFVLKISRSVPELKSFLLNKGENVQKIITYLKDQELRKILFQKFSEEAYSDLAISAASRQNMEFNHKDANKGNALIHLAEYLDIDIQNTIAFGDGLNDISMLRAAGIGVAMSNSEEKVIEIADIIAESNDDDGVAKVLENFLF